MLREETPNRLMRTEESTTVPGLTLICILIGVIANIIIHLARKHCAHQLLSLNALNTHSLDSHHM